jgi:Tol biopolymer transport system component
VVVSLDGTGFTRLTDSPWEDNDPEWSPDGTKIAFKSTRLTQEHAREEIFVMNADGSQVQRLTLLRAGSRTTIPVGARIAKKSPSAGSKVSGDGPTSPTWIFSSSTGGSSCPGIFTRWIYPGRLKL